MILEAEIRQKTKIKNMPFIFVFLRYQQLKICRNIPVREQAALYGEKKVNSRSEMHSNPQVEQYMDSSLLRIDRREEDYGIQKS